MPMPASFPCTVETGDEGVCLHAAMDARASLKVVPLHLTQEWLRIKEIHGDSCLFPWGLESEGKPRYGSFLKDFS